MDFEKFSDRLKGFVQSAQTLALREGNPQITPLSDAIQAARSRS